jgi:hypothetical protein
MPAFSLLGRPLRAEVASAALRDWLHAHWHFPEHALPAHPFTLRLRELDAPPPGAPSGGHAERARIPGREIAYVRKGSTWWMGSAAAGVRMTLDDAGSRLEAWGAGDRSLYPALFVALAESLRAGGLVPLHAAVAAGPEGATAFVARSGTGKSTTLLRLARAGWTPMAEDFAWLDPATLRVYGWDRSVHLWPAGRDAFAADVEGWRPAADGKLFLPFTAFAPDGPRSGPLVRVALLTRTDAEPAGWAPLPPRQAVRALWEAAGVPLSPWGQAVTEACVPRLLRLPLLRLNLGPGDLAPWSRIRN